MRDLPNYCEIYFEMIDKCNVDEWFEYILIAKLISLFKVIKTLKLILGSIFFKIWMFCIFLLRIW